MVSEIKGNKNEIIQKVVEKDRDFKVVEKDRDFIKMAVEAVIDYFEGMEEGSEEWI